LWFGADIPADFDDPAWRIALAEQWLKPLPFFQNLLKVLGGRPRGMDAILAELSRRTPLPSPTSDHPTYHANLVNSIAALASAARLPPLPGGEEKTRPFLDVRVQLWVRELRRMVSPVGPLPRLRFSDDLSDDERGLHLPVVHCLDCDRSGWASLLAAGESALRTDLRDFYIGFFGRDPRVTFLFPTETGGRQRIGPERGRTHLLCGNCLTLGADPDAGRCGSCRHDDALVRVFIPDNKRSVTRRDGTTRLEGVHDCPFCHSRNGLTVLGSQAASLTSVMLGSLFATPFGEQGDRQVIAFSDSVQDAAHRAGFFGARTYRLNFRTALQRASEAAGEGVSLAELTDRTARFWQKTLGDDARYVGTFLPADLEWLHGWNELRETGKLGNQFDLLGIVDRRVAWEVVSEHGLRARLGRTLERAGASIVRPDPRRLDDAVLALLPILQNEVGGLRRASEERLRVFLLGLLLHLRQQGGILHPFLDDYVNQGGNTFVLGRPRHMPRFGPASRAPGFYTDAALPRSSFERVLSNSGNRAWSAGWASTCFAELEPLVAEYLDRFLPPALAALVRAGLLEERCIARGGHRVWGLRPDALLLSLNVERLRCARCHHEIAAASDEAGYWEGAPCLRVFCGGTYARARSDDQAYYRSLYGHGRVHRVVAREHTSLLNREIRETLERRFIECGRGEGWPWDPNVLSATSTLELGVDIGELSTVLLCSIPPTTANYLQRVGRSGRRDGNALNVAIANGRPHDLYFFTDPDEILAGVIEPPGVFLNASAILERQFTAYCFDRWVASGISEDGFPGRLGEVLTNVEGNRLAAFPHTWLEFIDNNRTEFFAAFVELFAGELDAETVDQLRRFVEGEVEREGSLRWRILSGLEALVNERESLRKRVRALGTRIRRLRQTSVKSQDWQEELEALQREREGLRELVASIDGKETLNFFTDEGWIPNYAFPEAGVTLRSVIWRRRREEEDEGRRYETWSYEYMRAAAVALSELAPSSHFYAEGRRVQVDQVDLTLSQPRDWRLCRSCAHAEEILTADPPVAACPRCSDVMWPDNGRKRRMLRLRQVMATTSDRDSRIGDDSDDREPAFFTRQLLVDFTEDNIRESWAIDDPDFPFGFEFLTKAVFRDINFGERVAGAEAVEVAGVPAVRVGFRVCRHCGKVQRNSDEPEHALTCPTRGNQGEAAQAGAYEDCLYLYREFASEAIRILLPATAFAGSERRVHSFVAALQLGLKRKFRGAVGHLQTTVYEEPIAGALHRKKYLFLYDTVPGGTGYLKQLMREKEPLLEVLALALDALRACGCNQEPPPVDGCYRCLYAYRNAADMPETSRETAKELLAEILRRRDALKRSAFLSKIEVNGLFDSELEARFVEALRRADTPERPVVLQKQIVQGKPGYFITVGDRSWSVEPQAPVGPKDGVTVPSKADFLFRPARQRDGIRPVAVFTDGFHYHRDRVGEDMRQRTAIVRSGRFHVWSLTWGDVENRFTPKLGRFTNFLTAELNAGFARSLGDFMARFSVEKLREANVEDSFTWLIRFLAEPDRGLWSRWALVRSAGHTQAPSQVDETEWEASLEALLPASGADEAAVIGRPRLLGRHVFKANDSGPPVTLMVAIAAAALQAPDPNGAFLACVLDDDFAGSTPAEAERLWNGFLRLHNLFQFSRYANFATRRQIETGAFFAAPSAAAPPVAEVSGWEEVLSLVADELRPLAERLAEKGGPLPILGFELADEAGAVIAEAEFGWPELRIAVVREDQCGFLSVFTAAAWRAFIAAEVTEPERLFE